ncbi:MAG: Ig-like domain-containing protein [Treponema sp.]|nr:Ig-like domain-containing protein [Treponema sp.]
MFKRNLFIVVLLVIFSVNLWAGGGRDANESRTAEDQSGFTDSIDVNEKKKGKYNYYLEATDRAGNKMRAGPDNIYIDPESDLPIATIINPLPYMRVQGNMNIVGIAFDDDGIQRVEVAVYRGIDGRGEEILRVTAEGTDYWSYFLNTSDENIWSDGNYTVSAWAVDINGLSGISDNFKIKQRKISTVYWRLDRKKPDTVITSHEVGALVSGNISLRGTVKDGNGISSLSYSTDEGQKYSPVKVNIDKKDGNNKWELSLNTRQFEDGPNVIWFQAVDGNGSIGTAAHLLFVNNTGPDVKIVYPSANDTVNGLFSIAGYAKHPVGLRSVSWKAGTASGEFEMLPGNHWWSADVDIRNKKDTSIDVEVRAVDVSGNVTVERQRFKVNPLADLPVITITEPAAGGYNNPLGIIVKGNAEDDDGIASIFYSLNNGPSTELPATSGYFQFMIPTPPEGIHTLDVWAKDIAGVIGNKTQVKGIVISGGSIQPGIASFTSLEGRNSIVSNFYTGMSIKITPRMTAQLAFKATSAPVSATVAFGNQVPAQVKLTAAKDVYTATVPVPEFIEDGLLEIKMTGTDRNGKEFAFSEFVFVNSLLAATAQALGLSNEYAAPAVNFRAQDHRLTWVRQTVLSDGRILLKQGEQLLGLSTIPVRGAVVSGPGADSLDVQVDNYGRVLITAAREGEAGPLTVRLDVDGVNSYTSSQFRTVADFSGPTVTVRDLANYSFIRNNIPVTFNVSSRNRVSAVEYSLDMGQTWINIISPAEARAIAAPVNTNVSRTLELASAQDGTINVLIRGTSDTGLTSVAEFTVLKDTTAPIGKIIMPIAESKVNGTIRMAFSVEEMGALRSITYSRGGGTPREVFNETRWDKDYSPRFFEILMDAVEMPLDPNMRFTFTDRSGNSSILSSWDFIIDREMDIPVVHIILPLENEVITTDFIVSGVMFDDDAIKQVTWRIDNGNQFVIEAENGFSIPVALNTLTDNEHTVTLIAEDIYGVRSAPITRNFRVSLSEPAATVVYPSYDTVLKGEIEVRGTAFDRNGIKEIKVSVDNGNTFNAVRGNFGTAAQTVNWTYQFNTTILKDGPHVLFIRVVDRYDIPATYANMINIDNTPPDVTLDSPGDGSMTAGQISVMGRVLDPNLRDIAIEIRSLDGITIPANYQRRVLELNPMIREGIDISSLADGQYNIAVIAHDRAGNMSRISRNIQMARQSYRPTIEILYPLENEETSGEFNLYGVTAGAVQAGNVTIRINGSDSETIEVDDNGYFTFKMNPEKLNIGNNSIVVHSNFGGPTVIQSRAFNLVYRDGGPWVTIDSFEFADFAYDRPYLFGRTGYNLNEEDTALLADRNTDKVARAKILTKVPDFTEISFDNGRTFIPTEKGKRGQDYRYRLETGEMTEGYHYIVVRTTMKNGEIAVTRMLVQVDKTPPVIKLISPEMGGRYNQQIAYSASATDDNELVSLTYHIRKGDKSAYEVPGFLQGLYFEGIIPPWLRMLAVKSGNEKFEKYVPAGIFGGGATFFDVGLGLSFFGDNVKVQAQYGMMTQKQYEWLGGTGPVRYGGHVLGLKLLANLYRLPFGAFAGPDWEWLSATFALGANFSLFNLMQEDNPMIDGQKYSQSGSRTWMSALLLQIEFPRITLPKRDFLRTFSVFWEGQLWFVPTDVNLEKSGSSIFFPHIVIGIRLYIF